MPISVEALGFLFGVIGNVTTSILYLSPIGTFKRIIKNGSTEEFGSFPYICMLLNATLWTYYGIIKPNAFLVATVNGFGVGVLIIYIGIFLNFAPPKIKVKTAALAAVLNVGLVAGAIFLTRLGMDEETQITCIGLLSAAFSILSYASPLAAMGTVLKTKSVEYMPFLLSFSVFINGVSWTVYAVLVRDYFVGVPNGTGFVFGAIQLVLYLLYRNANRPKSAIGVLEEGWQHQPLILS